MRRIIRLAIVLALTLAAAHVFAGCSWFEDEIASPKSQIDIAKDASVKVSIRSIQTGIQAFIATNSALPPRATRDVLGGFVQPWPQNPWTKTDMTEGTQPGNFSYRQGTGVSYTLVVHLSGGREYAIQ